jgi:hypothetical protein
MKTILILLCMSAAALAQSTGDYLLQRRQTGNPQYVPVYLTPTGGSLLGFDHGGLPTLTASSSFQGAIAAGTTGQYWRGDKTWQTLDKTAVGLGSVENTALSTWAGSANVTTLGTIGTGTWNATTIAVARGGTGTTTGSITGTGALTFTSGSNSNIVLAASGTGIVTTADVVNITDSTAATSTSTGALVISGGLGVGGNIHSANITTGTGTAQAWAASNTGYFQISTFGFINGSTGVASELQNLNAAGNAAGSWKTGGFRTAITAKTASYTATLTDFTIACDATSGAITITLPAAASHTGRIYVVKKTDASGNAVTIDPNASETIDGATTEVISAQWGVSTIQSNGTNWLKL